MCETAGINGCRHLQSTYGREFCTILEQAHNQRGGVETHPQSGQTIPRRRRRGLAADSTEGTATALGTSRRFRRTSCCGLSCRRSHALPEKLRERRGGGAEVGLHLDEGPQPSGELPLIIRLLQDMLDCSATDIDVETLALNCNA